MNKNVSIQDGLVIAYFGQSILLKNKAGEDVVCLLKRNQVTPVVGDQVKYYLDDHQNGMITEILPRGLCLYRAQKNKQKCIAANLDFLGIVFPPPPQFSEYLLNRYLLAANLLNLKALIIINKKDLLSASESSNLQTLLHPYEKLEAEVLFTSAKEPHGLEDAQKIVKDQRGVLVGVSGAGKSSIIRALCHADEIKIQNTSEKGLGKHTTTGTALYFMRDSKGYLIDSPGVREFDLWDLDLEQLEMSFKEFQDYKSSCRFRNCKHLLEPNCGIVAAVNEGKIIKARYETYATLFKTISTKEKYD